MIRSIWSNFEKLIAFWKLIGEMMTAVLRFTLNVFPSSFLYLNWSQFGHYCPL